MIKIEDLSVKFEKSIFDNFNMEFSDSGIYCIYGPSGFGKTTLLNAIAGLIKYDGRIIKDGSVSYLFQEDRLLNWLSAKENIMLVEPEKEYTEFLISALGIKEFEDKKPKELSGGMKRRVAIARCLGFNADIYLLDEPFKGLDNDNVQAIYSVLKELAKEKLIIIVTHDEGVASEVGAEVISFFGI